MHGPDATAKQRADFRGVFRNAFDVPASTPVPSPPEFKRSISMELVRRSILKTERALEKLQWFYVPVLLKAPIIDILSACLLVLEEYKKLAAAYEKTPSWEALEAFHFATVCNTSM